MAMNKLFTLLMTLLVASCVSGPVTHVEELCLTAGGNRVFGEFYHPEGKAPLVVISHGFNGSHESAKPYAKALSEMGYAVYCFDFPGGSTYSLSEGKTTEMSIFKEKSDLISIVNALWERADVIPGKVTLIGESQGGMVSALVAAELGEKVERLFLIYPAFCIKDDWVELYPSVEEMPDEVDFWGVRLGRAYRDGLDSLDVYGTISQYHGPVVIYHGDKDPVVNISYSEQAAEAYPSAKLVVYEGEGHGFSPEVTAKTVESIVDNIKSKVPNYMIDEKILNELRGRDVVLFVATEGEVDESASPFPVVISGYGKMRMYAALVRWYESLEEGRHPIVLNIGSAGSAKYPIGEVINVGSFINGGDAFVHDRIEAPREGASVYSGDFFMSAKTFSPEEVKRLSSDYDLFDMEAYAVAYFCSSYGVPYYCFKAVSDNLDGSVKDWENILGDIKATFSQLLARLK